MALTEAEKLLVRGAKIIGADRNEAVSIILAVRDPMQQEILLEWMDKNLDTATMSDLIGITMDIVAGKNS